MDEQQTMLPSPLLRHVAGRKRGQYIEEVDDT